MSVTTPNPPRSKIIYPDSDGQPMADNPLQFRWIVTIKEGTERAYRHRADIFVAGDMLWYPVEGHPEICQAPDVLIALGPAEGIPRFVQAMGRRRDRATGRLRGPVAGEPGGTNDPEVQVLRTIWGLGMVLPHF
jgi:hypothetical protein